MSIESFEAALRALREGRAFAWVTVLQVEGSSPGRPGQKMMVYADGRTEGTVGGGVLELRARNDALEMLGAGKGGVRSYALDPASPESIGSVCGGSALLAIEVFPAAVHLLLCGAGHVAQAVARLCPDLEFVHSVVDHRPEMAAAERFPRAAEVAAQSPSDYLLARDLGRYTHVLIMTHGHAHDSACLSACFRAGFGGVIGMLGSRRKWREVRSALERKGLPAEWLDRVHCPLGLPLGSQNPAEIAVSITAWIIRERRIGPAPAETGEA